MTGKRMFVTYKEAKKRGFFDEYPMLPDDVDCQMHLSRNNKPQPFYLICEKDTVLAQMSGEASVEFKESSVLTFKMELGDYIYVPAGTPHRITPVTESIQYRYKAPQAGLEGVSWFCSGCGNEVTRVEWDTKEEISQQQYLDATTQFNQDESMRTCSSCGEVHAPVDIDGNQWTEIAAELSESA